MFMDGTFTRTYECKTIECGIPPEANNTKRSRDIMYYQDEVTYTLDEGYSLDGKFGCKTELEGVFVFMEEPYVECGEGYLLDRLGRLLSVHAE